MINGKKVLAIIPARGGSKGLPRKNILELLGRPLLGWPIQAARKSKYIDRVIVSTEDRAIADIALSQGAEVPFLRQEELAADTSTSMSVIEHAIRFVKSQEEFYDYCVLLEPTSPLTEEQDIDNALDKLDRNRSIADAIVGVSRVEATHPAFDVKIAENGLIEPYMNNDSANSLRRQDIPEVYFFDGSIYISDIAVLFEKRGFYHARTLPFVTPKWKSFEIDDIVDFICVEAIMRNIDKIKRSAE